MVVNVGSGVIVNGTVDTSGNPSLLTLNLSSSGLTINSNASFSGAVVAPTGTVIVNGTLTGGVTCDRLIVNGGGTLR